MWLIDPITGKPSVALTMLVVASCLMVVAIVMECFTNLRSTHVLDELFGGALALYGGHMTVFRASGMRSQDPPQPPAADIQPD